MIYRIMFKKHGENEEQCIYSSTDVEMAAEELDRLVCSDLAKTGSLHMCRKGYPEEQKKE